MSNNNITDLLISLPKSNSMLSYMNINKNQVSNLLTLKIFRDFVKNNQKK